MIHRHLDYPPDTPPSELPTAAIADILDRGDLDDWLPLARVVADNPHGALAARISAVIEAQPMYGTSALWRAWLAHQRTRPPRAGLADLRRHAGLSQAELSVRLGISQSDVSKLERRSDLKVSTLRGYLAALGSRLQLRVSGPSGEADLAVGD
ncbi:hypothetical protein BH20ACT5_BH20ACT5_00340 [soil metagenome]